MRGEDGDGDDNGGNGSHSGPYRQLASSSLAWETPSAGGENASKWPLFTASKRYNSGVRNLLILPTLPLLDIASDAFCFGLCYILSCLNIKDDSVRAGLIDWVVIKGKIAADSVAADIHYRWWDSVRLLMTEHVKGALEEKSLYTPAHILHSNCYCLCGMEQHICGVVDLLMRFIPIDHTIPPFACTTTVFFENVFSYKLL